MNRECPSCSENSSSTLSTKASDPTATPFVTNLAFSCKRCGQSRTRGLLAAFSSAATVSLSNSSRLT